MSKRTKRIRADVYLGGKKIGKVEAAESKPIRIHAGRFRIGVKSTHDVDGSPAGDSCSHVDHVTHVMAKDKYELAEKLRELASFVANTESDFDTGTACIFIGRRYSSAALKRLRGE